MGAAGAAQSKVDSTPLSGGRFAGQPGLGQCGIAVTGLLDCTRELSSGFSSGKHHVAKLAIDVADCGVAGVGLWGQSAAQRAAGAYLVAEFRSRKDRPVRARCQLTT